MQKNSAIIEKVVIGIASVDLVAPLPSEPSSSSDQGPKSSARGNVMELQEFYEHMEQHRSEAVEAQVGLKLVQHVPLTQQRGWDRNLQYDKRQDAVSQRVCAGVTALHAATYLFMLDGCPCHHYMRCDMLLHCCKCLPACLPACLTNRSMPRLQVKKYRSLGPLLGKVEELVAGTNSGKAPALAGYYSFWEQAVFNALVLMVLRALQRLHTLLSSSSSKPLFRVSGG